MPYPIERGSGRSRTGPLVPGFMRRLGAVLEAMPRRALGSIVALLLVLVTIIDVVTPPSVVVGVFYIVPIILASCWLGPRAAILSVIIGGLGVLLAQSLGPGELVGLGTRIWNAAAHAILFFIVAAIQSSLCAALAHERELARTDPVTGVVNTRYFMQLAHREQRRARRYRTPVTVGYLCVEWNDGTADANDRRSAEQIATDVATALAACVREIDVLARTAAGEFAILLPHADAQGARIVFERVNDTLEQVRTRRPIRWSAGVVTFSVPPDETDELVRAAERLMFSVRSAGGGIRYAAISPESVQAHSPFGA